MKFQKIILKKILNNKIKSIFIFLFIFGVAAFIGSWVAVSGGHDKQNKVILFFKSIIPVKVYQKARDTIFIIPNLKERNKFYKTQVDKYEQGLNGNLFNTEICISQNNKKKFELKEFFLPFQRLDLRLGWLGEKNSRRAHHFEIINDKIIVLSGKGQTIYFNKKNIFKKKLNQIEIKNNIKDILKENNLELIGMRDLFVEDEKIYFSMITRETKGITINVYRADLNYENLVFNVFFETNAYWPGYNVFSGGRLSTFKDNKILFTIGYSGVDGSAQNLDSLLGKIISIDKNTGSHEIISYGHRNPQGLFYINEENIIINTEHGPKGGDEININFLDKQKLPNYGWNIASYGINYDGTDPFKHSHADYGFVEPFKYFTPSIGISQLFYMPKKLNSDNEKYLYITSLRAASIYIIKTNDEFNKIIDEDRIFFGQKRIRDIKYDEENKVFFLIFEFTPSIAVLKIL